MHFTSVTKYHYMIILLSVQTYFFMLIFKLVTRVFIKKRKEISGTLIKACNNFVNVEVLFLIIVMSKVCSCPPNIYSLIKFTDFIVE